MAIWIIRSNFVVQKETGDKIFNFLTKGERNVCQQLVFAHNAEQPASSTENLGPYYFDNALLAGLDVIKADPWLYGYYDDKIKSVEQMLRNRGAMPWVDVKHAVDAPQGAVPHETVDFREWMDFDNDGWWRR